MNTKPFHLPMTKKEQIVGLVYLPIHIFALPFLISFVNVYMLGAVSVTLSDAAVTLVYYAFSFLFVLIFLHRYLKSTFSDLFDHFRGSIWTVILGFVFYYALLYAVTLVLAFFVPDLTNPNTEVIHSETQLNANVIIAFTVLLAPVVEETLFRGVLFGSLRKKNRLAAYLISAVLFSAYHLWGYFLTSYDWTLLLSLLQYVPGAIVLAWSYERSGSLWTAIFLHSMINLLSMYVQTS